MKRLVSVALIALVSAPAGAQQRTPAAGDVSTTVRVEVVQLDVLAVDGKDRPVLDLKQDDFDVRIAGKAQPLEGFEPPKVVPAASAPAPPPELTGGSTQPIVPASAPALHVLFLVDEEELPVTGIRAAAKQALEFTKTAHGARIGLVTHFGRNAMRLWDEASTERLEIEMQAAADEAVGVSELKSELAGDPRTGSQDVVNVERRYEPRLRKEADLVDEIVRQESEPNRNEQLIADLYRRFGLYLRAERLRVADGLDELRLTLQRFANLGDRRHAILFSRGIERVPGSGLVALLEAAQKEHKNALSGAPPRFGGPDLRRGFEGDLPRSLQGRVVWDSSPLPQLDELTDELAASGVTFHVIDPSAGADIVGAEHGFVAAIRDRAYDRQLHADGVSAIVSATGGVMRMNQGSLGGLAETLQGNYRLAVRVSGVQPEKTYKVVVRCRRPGVRILTRSAFKPTTAAAKGSQTVERVEDAVRAAMKDGRRPGAARLGPRQIPLKLAWKGKKGAFYELEVRVPHDAIGFVPEEDAMVASARITVTPLALGAASAEPVTDDLFLSYTGAEYSAAQGTELVRTEKLALPPGRYQLTVTIEDALLEKSAGMERITVEAN